MHAHARSFVKPGDGLLYGGSGLVNRIIGWRTWSRYSHVEVAYGTDLAGNVCTAASRGPVSGSNQSGVGVYVMRDEGLSMILRPMQPFDIRAANEWLGDVTGQGYDYLALLNFTLAKAMCRTKWGKAWSLNRQICSEFAVRYWRKMGVVPCHPNFDADLIAPSNLAMMPGFEQYEVDAHGMVKVDVPSVVEV